MPCGRCAPRRPAERPASYGSTSSRRDPSRSAMSDPCPRCPCPETCLRWPPFCEMAAAEPPDPVHLRHIIHRSAIGAVSPQHQSIAAPTPADVLPLVAAMKACPFRSSGPGCGCSGGRCALRRGAPVSHLDCFDCLQQYPHFVAAEARSGRRASDRREDGPREISHKGNFAQLEVVFQ